MQRLSIQRRQSQTTFATNRIVAGKPRMFRNPGGLHVFIITEVYVWNKDLKRKATCYLHRKTPNQSNISHWRPLLNSSILWQLKGTLASDFFFSTFCTDQTNIGQRIKLLSISILFLNSPKYSNFFTFGGDSVEWSLNLNQLSQRWVRLQIDSVNAESDFTSTKLTRNDEIFVDTSTFRVDSVDVESRSALT
jgi:hypothetical protein